MTFKSSKLSAVISFFVASILQIASTSDSYLQDANGDHILLRNQNHGTVESMKY